MQRYKHIYIDLDRTLWDFKVNSAETLRDLYVKYNLSNVFPGYDIFKDRFISNNDILWEQYYKGEIKKDILRTLRFHMTLGDYGLKDKELAKSLDDDYIMISPTKTSLFPHTLESLDYLYSKYNLYIITNGFNEVQFTKLRNSGLEKYFKRIVTSESTGYMKPRIEIFNYAVTSANARKKECIMIGDDLQADILGAKNAGIDQVYFNPEKIQHEETPSFEIYSLIELKNIF